MNGHYYAMSKNTIIAQSKSLSEVENAALCYLVNCPEIDEVHLWYHNNIVGDTEEIDIRSVNEEALVERVRKNSRGVFEIIQRLVSDEAYRNGANNIVELHVLTMSLLNEDIRSRKELAAKLGRLIVNISTLLDVNEFLTAREKTLLNSVVNCWAGIV